MPVYENDLALDNKRLFPDEIKGDFETFSKSTGSSLFSKKFFDDHFLCYRYDKKPQITFDKNNYIKNRI